VGDGQGTGPVRTAGAEEYGGQGLDFSDMLPSFEQVGRSLIGALAIRANAPQEGNMHTLEMVGTEEQKEEWLRPLVQGRFRRRSR